MGPDDDHRSWSDDDRPSWRELDKRRDRSNYRREEKPAFTGTKKQQAYAKQVALREADKLFAKKTDAQQVAALEELEQAKGTDRFDELAGQFLEKFGVTDDWHVQLLLCEAGPSKIAVPAIEALVAGIAERTPGEVRAIKSRLRIAAMTGKTKTKMAAKTALESIE
ncbi:MAG TPA: hypothetical protein PKW95_12715 [bacterium]|nr:hypothetical protein [bacterium]